MKALTPKQQDRLRTKIIRIRKTLAAERRKFGGYDDSRGLRYVPPELYIKLQDFKGGLTYMRWFRKNFPDDICFSDFLFEWTLILFRNGKNKEAERKALATWFSNVYLFDRFFNRPVVPVHNYQASNLQESELAVNFPYAAAQPGLEDFAAWLGQLERTEEFRERTSRYLTIQILLNTEEDIRKRSALLDEERQLLESY